MNREEVDLCAGALRGGTSRGAWKALARRRTEQAGADRSHEKSSQSSTERQKREVVHQIVDAGETEREWRRIFNPRLTRSSSRLPSSRVVGTDG